MKKLIWALSLFILFQVPPNSPAQTIHTLSKKISQPLHRKNYQLKIAVSRFVYSRNRMSTGSHLVSERLITEMVRDGHFVVERQLFDKILEEKKWADTGVIDPQTAKSLGTLLEVNAILVGTLEDLSQDQTRVSARLIKTETGEIISAGSVIIEREWDDFPKLARVAQSRSPSPYSNPSWDPHFDEQENRRRYNLKSAPESKSKYHLAPVPFLNPGAGFR